LRTGRVITLATDVLPDYGVAATRDRVFYASQAPSGRVQLAGIRYDGSGHQILSGYLAAPIAARGNAVGWAEVDGARFDVIVRDAIQGATWLAASLPRCATDGCYRIDAVTLADRGIVFDMGAVGPQPSHVVRRSFDSAHPTSIDLPDDAQPDLVPSSAGALYYWFSHGWYRWDFADKHPRLTSYRGATPAPVLGFEHSHFFVAEPRGTCESAVLATPEHGPSIVLQQSKMLSRLADRRNQGCANLTDLTWTGHQTLTAWAIESPKAENRHEDAGLLGVIVGGLQTTAFRESGK
jgi:hypothetical protein